jgi:hypothetical protein
MLRVSMVAGSLAAAGLLAGCQSGSVMGGGSQTAQAPTKTFSATLTGTQEVPPVQTDGHGNAVVTWNPTTREVTWNVTYEGLSGPATAAHFHGPAGPGQNAGVQINIAPAGRPESPLTGSATLTDAQAQQLASGMWYVNVHTKAHPNGEIRGQVAAK